MKTLKCMFLVTAIVLMLVLAPGGTWVVNSRSQPNFVSAKSYSAPAAPVSQDIPQWIKGLVNQAFKAVSNVAIPFANLIQKAVIVATSAASKDLKDFSSCPSNDAQLLYNNLKTHRNNLNQTIAAAKQADEQAQQARVNCKNTVPADFRAQCDLAYNNLSFAATKVAAENARSAVQSAMNVLTSLKCISGCNKTGKLVVPTVGLEPGGTLNLNQTAQTIIDLNKTNPREDVLPAAPRPTNGRLDTTVCTAWNFGQFGVNLDAVGSGDFSQMFGYRAPGCSRTEKLSICTNWNMSVLLPKLKELRIVPPGVQLPDVEIVVPNRTFRVVSNVTQSACRTPVTICTRPSGSLVINFNKGTNPLDILSTSACDETRTIGCSDPLFGLTPTYTTIQVPDLAHAKVKIKAGRVTTAAELIVDLTRPEFKLSCAGQDLQLPMPPRLRYGTQVIDLPYVCTEPRFVSVVANP